MPDACRIRPALPQDEAQWRILWDAYNRFYEAIVSPSATNATWARILDEGSAIGCLVAEETRSGTLQGFATYIIHPRTWSERDTCYMEDLYVDAAMRGRGTGKQLCLALKTLCAARGLSQIYWNTRESNHAARALYDRIAARDDFVRYVMRLET